MESFWTLLNIGLKLVGWILFASCLWAYLSDGNQPSNFKVMLIIILLFK